MAKVLLINGSPKPNGGTAAVLDEMVTVFNNEGIESEIIQVGSKNIRGCAGCLYCREEGKCIYKDIVNDVAKKFETADGLVVASPVYYASPHGAIIAFMDRLMYSTQFSKHMKVGAAVVNTIRGGNSSSFDILNKYFHVSGMPIAPSTYWNMAYGFTPEDIKKDEEGMQTMRNLARNMSFMIRALADAKEKYGLPKIETSKHTSFSDGK